MMPLPPRWFSTIAGCPFSLSLWARMRAARSPRPPAGTPTMILIGCDGASCACTGMAAKSMQITNSAALRRRRVSERSRSSCLLRVRMRGWATLRSRSALSMVRMDHDIDEPARARLHLGQRVIDLRKRIGVRDELGQVKHTKLRHLGHRLALACREPVRAAELQTSGHKTDRLDRERLGQGADIDRDCATLERGKRLGGVRSGGTARGAIDERVHAKLVRVPSHPIGDRSIAEREDLDTVRRQRSQLCKHVTIAAKAENPRRPHCEGQ